MTNDRKILGERRKPGMWRDGSVSSGRNNGRNLLANVTDALAGTLGEEPPVDVVVGTDANIELVSRLLLDAEASLPNAFPEAVLLPPDP